MVETDKNRFLDLGLVAVQKGIRPLCWRRSQRFDVPAQGQGHAMFQGRSFGLDSGWRMPYRLRRIICSTIVLPAN